MASKPTVSNSNVEIVIAVWLDANININEENRNAQLQLRSFINRLTTFENVDECEKYIRSASPQEQLILIVSGRLGRELVPNIHALRNVTSIYVYCSDKNGNEQWAKHFSKIKSVIIRLDELLFRIRSDQESLCSVDQIEIPSIPVFNDKMDKQNLSLAYAHLLSCVLVQMTESATDKNDLISLCKDSFQNNERELQIINRFQKTYFSDKAIYWLTEDSFIHKMLNRALRTQDTNIIFLFQFFVRDIHRQLAQIQSQHHIKVYRAQSMSADELNNLRESVGSLITMNSILATSSNREQALGFLSTDNYSNDFQRILFEIDAESEATATKPFANIYRYSAFPSEDEILFAYGSFFRIINVQQNSDQIWIIRMTLCGDNDHAVKKFLAEITKKFGNNEGEGAFFAFIRVLCAMKKFDEAEKYCERLLQYFSSDESSLGILYDELAKIASNQNDHDLSTQWHEKSKKIKKKFGSGRSDNSIAASNSNSDYESSDFRGINNSTSVTAVSKFMTSDDHPFGNNFRFLDVAAEKHDILLPIEGHEKMPLVTLEEAVAPLISILPDIRRKVHTAKLKCKNPADGLTSDESAAIMLYTMEWEPQDECLYFALNARLREADRKKLKSWFLYLKLILTGLSHLPSVKRTVYRGVKYNLSSKYDEGEQFFWWGFSSCTTNMNVLKSEQFLGKNGTRTIFHIECINGKDIRRHSYYEKEDEILLLPATYLEVVSNFEMALGLHAIQLKEIKPEFPYLEPVA